MARYLIIQAEEKTFYAGEGRIEEWRKKLGEEPNKQEYRVIEINVHKNSPPQLFEMVITDSLLTSNKGYREYNDSTNFTYFTLDEKVRGLLQGIFSLDSRTKQTEE